MFRWERVPPKSNQTMTYTAYQHENCSCRFCLTSVLRPSSRAFNYFVRSILAYGRKPLHKNSKIFVESRNSDLGYGFEPRPNSLEHVPAGSVMISDDHRIINKMMLALGKDV